jgi:hypothetical protein
MSLVIARSWVVGGLMIGVLSWCVLAIASPPGAPPEAARSECAGLTEERCFAHPGCRGAYGSSEGVTTDEAFRECLPIPAAELARAHTDQPLCVKTGGRWLRDRYSEPGRCQCDASSFYAGAGCRTMEQDCAASGGVLWPAHSFPCEGWRERLPFACGEGAATNRFSFCLCPSGQVWHYERRCQAP